MTEQQSAKRGVSFSESWEHPTGETPQTVAIVACGPTSHSYHTNNFSYTPATPAPDEVWSLNKAPRTTRCDLAFIMDDIVGECRKSAVFAEDIGRFLNDFRVPVITSTVDFDVLRAVGVAPPGEYDPYDHPAFTTDRDRFLSEYPLDAVLTSVGVRVLLARGYSATQIMDAPGDVKHAGHGTGFYLHNSIPYMLAYALFIGVQRVYLYGADYTYPGMAAREDDRANTEYWVGLLRMAGVEVWVGKDTTLLNTRMQPHLYGFGARPPILQEPTRSDIAYALSDIGIERHQVATQLAEKAKE